MSAVAEPLRRVPKQHRAEERIRRILDAADAILAEGEDARRAYIASRLGASRLGGDGDG